MIALDPSCDCTKVISAPLVPHLETTHTCILLYPLIF